MKRRTTIEIDDDLLQRARQALGKGTTRATVEEALRIAAESTRESRLTVAKRQLEVLQRLCDYADLTILETEEMWR